MNNLREQNSLKNASGSSPQIKASFKTIARQTSAVDQHHPLIRAIASQLNCNASAVCRAILLMGTIDLRGTSALLRRPVAFRRSGHKHSAYYANISRGLIPPFVKIGTTALVPAHELAALNAARIAAFDNESIVVLVKVLVALRLELGRGPVSKALAHFGHIEQSSNPISTIKENDYARQ